MKPSTQTFFTDLAGMMPMDPEEMTPEEEIKAKKIDGMSAGTFTDMWGSEWTYKVDDLPAYVANTNRALESTRDSSGQIVGFPIDSMNHNHGAAVGWITGVSLAAGRPVIEFDVRWNWAGMDTIAADEMRYFSPSIDVGKMVIVGGSLTNWPATRTDDHQILLRPVELSSQMFSLDAPKIETGESFWTRLKELVSGLLKPAQTPTPEGETSMPEELTVVTPPAVVDLSSPEIAQLIDARAEERATAMLAQREHAANIISLSARLIGGTSDVPRGLPVAQEELTAFLSALPADQYPKAEAILSRILHAGLVNYQEQGHSRELQGTKELPDVIRPMLRSWLKAGKELSEFFQVNSVELGAQSDYNLTDFVSKEK
jgi:hypothetical protein